MLEKRTLKFRVIYTSVLFVIFVASFVYFCVGVQELLMQLKFLGAFVEYDKVPFATLGVSLGALGFLLEAYFNQVKLIGTPKNIHLIVFYLWMAGAFLAIALPIFAKYGVQYYIYGKGYSYCREAEYEGNVRQVSLFYTRDRESCIRVALKESLRFRRDAIEYLEEKKKKEL